MLAGIWVDPQTKPLLQLQSQCVFVTFGLLFSSTLQAYGLEFSKVVNWITFVIPKRNHSCNYNPNASLTHFGFLFSSTPQAYSIELSKIVNWITFVIPKRNHSCNYNPNASLTHLDFYFLQLLKLSAWSFSK